MEMEGLKNGFNLFHICLLQLEANLLASQPVLHHRLPLLWLRQAASGGESLPFAVIQQKERLLRIHLADARLLVDKDMIDPAARE